MAANPNRPQLVAVDANVLFDLADGVENVVDSVSLIRERLHEARLILPPTVQHELANWALRGNTEEKRRAGLRAIQIAQSWHIIPANLLAVRHGIADRIAHRLRELGLVPQEEIHDSLILAEASLLNSSILLTSDEHLRGIDFERLTFELQAFDVTAPIIATPKEIVKKFFR